MVTLDLEAKKTSKAALAVIEATNGKFFKTRFFCRTEKRMRTMLCRTGVTAAMKVGPHAKAYRDEDHNLKTVFDVKLERYRAIPLEGVFEVKCGPVSLVLNSKTITQRKLECMGQVLLKARK